MTDENLFVVEIEELDRRNRTERLLDDLLNLQQKSDSAIKSPLDLTREIVDLYLKVVRRRNHLRRNWHPQQSMHCNMVVLDRLGNKGAHSSIINQMDEVIANAHKWDRQKIKESMEIVKEEFNRAISKGHFDIARTSRNDGLRAKEGGGTIVKVHDDVVEHRDPNKPSRLNKLTSHRRLRNIFTEVKRER